MQCITVIIKNEKGELLMQNHVKIGKWTFPGGHLEYNESPVQGMVREVYEELDVVITKSHKVGALEITNEYPINSGNWVTDEHTFFMVERFSGDIKNKEPEKHKELKWMSIDEILTIFDKMSLVVQNYLNKIERGENNADN